MTAPERAVLDEDALKERIAAELEEVRRRSLALTTGALDEPELTSQHSRLMSPLVWDLAHVGNYEELWLLRTTVGAEALVRPEIDDMYDAFEHPRAERPRLPLLAPAEAESYLALVRRKVLDALEQVRLRPDAPLFDGGYVYGMVVQHEHQHDETMLATHQLRRGAPVLPADDAPPPDPGPIPPAEVRVPAGPFLMGTSAEAWAYDNERPAHRVDLPAYWIDTVPVSNAAYASFVEAGGYDDPRWWHPDGWSWRCTSGKRAPAFWRREGGQWLRRRFGRVEPLPAEEPVQHVCWYEADAYARFAGRRLPTEAEWEKAASWDPDAHRARRHPWGDGPPGAEHANLGQRRHRPAPVGSYPAGASAYGVRQLLGDVWEWTASDFTGYPGFRPFPYREYSEVFFGPGHKVLRGGSWATHPSACRSTFRNWDLPIRRQIFAGFRCARDDSAS
ncbi:MAG: ergothioneine biosynthesis protein EgtB [Actinomycetota bacterium]|nr:ergothioneine biosynthesis protein EgtB [Actinomycetota bacterium]